MNLIKWKVLRKNGIPVNLVDLRRCVLKKANRNTKDLCHFLPIEAAGIIIKTAKKAVNYTERSLKAVVVVFAILPIMMVYPKLQKYFEKGAMLGSVKG